MNELRPYQVEAVEASCRLLEAGTSALLVQATGTGKTRTAVAIAERLRSCGRVLWLAHRGELLAQAQAAFRAETGLSAEIEMAQQRASRLAPPDVTLASVATLQGKRLESFAPDHFALVVADECHHAVSASWLSILDQFGAAVRLGLTATPDRLDRQGLGAVFAEVAYTYDLRRAIREGYLAPIRQRMVQIASVDFSAVRKSQGDLRVEDLEALLAQETPLHEVARPTLELAGERPTLVFGVTVAHAQALAAVLNRYRPDAARTIHGGMDVAARAELLAAFGRREFQYLCNVAVLTEGVDLPYVGCVAMARPTLSRALYTQMAGRATRLAAGKVDALLIDFVGNAGRHQLIGAIDLFSSASPRVRQLAQAQVDQDEQLLLLDAVEAAEVKVAAADAQLLERERARREAEEERRRRIQAEVRYTIRDLDPILGFPLVRQRGEVEEPPDDGQVEKLHKHGVDPRGLDRWQAFRVCQEIASRARRRLCTLKQARTLARFGLRADLSYDEAHRVMDALAANGWRLPPEIAADENLRRTA